jgi:predicted transcriptional regulator of viral defense system
MYNMVIDVFSEYSFTERASMQLASATKIGAFAQALAALGPDEFTTQDAHRVGLRLGVAPSYATEMLSRLEKQDKLVRIGHGRYLTMVNYRQRQPTP